MFLINRLLSTAVGNWSPHELLFKSKPDYFSLECLVICVSFIFALTELTNSHSYLSPVSSLDIVLHTMVINVYHHLVVSIHPKMLFFMNLHFLLMTPVVKFLVMCHPNMYQFQNHSLFLVILCFRQLFNLLCHQMFLLHMILSLSSM